MIRPKSKEFAARLTVLVAGDFLIGWAALRVAAEVRNRLADTPLHISAERIALYAGSLIVAMSLSGFYHARVTARARPSFITAVVIQIALVAMGGAALALPLSRTILLSVPVVELALLPLSRRVFAIVAPIRPRETILLGDAEDVRIALAGIRMAADRRLRVVEDGAPSLGDLETPAAAETLQQIEEVILVSPRADPSVRTSLLRIRGARGFLMLASHVDALLASRTRGWIGDLPLVSVAADCGHGLSAIVKRFVDVVLSALLLAASAPLWLAATLAILIDDGRPVLVRQKRLGLRGEPYGMWKFRSMRGDAESGGDDENRITRAGLLLRRYHLDELPQLLNVLAGDMSLVGPRPERPDLVAKIVQDVPDFDLRLLVRPGIAGLAQVSADYESRPEVKLRYDLMYMCNWSLWSDFQLMLRAVSTSLAGTGR